LKLSTKSLNPVGVLSTIGAGVGVGVAVVVAEGEGVGVGVVVPEGVGVAVGLVGTTTPLFHTSFFPLLMQVYFLPADVEVAPSFEHVEPALTAALATPVRSVSDTKNVKNLNLNLKESSQFE
jgi:uncharacterized membrane protein YdfJ with MMPL/SSD domain